VNAVTATVERLARPPAELSGGGAVAAFQAMRGDDPRSSTVSALRLLEPSALDIVFQRAQTVELQRGWPHE
jgi:hypothetical protein